jgi:hypothetical protein
MASPECDGFAAVLVDYAAQTLPDAERALVEAHVAKCADCAAALAALSEVPALLRTPAAQRDEAFWVAQRQSIMERLDAVDASIASSPQGFDWRLMLPIAAAVVIALAGYLSLRPPAVPGTVVLDALSSDDLSALVEVAADIVPADELLPDVQADANEAAEGAIEVEWIGADDIPTWGGLDDDDLEELHSILG